MNKMMKSNNMKRENFSFVQGPTSKFIKIMKNEDIKLIPKIKVRGNFE